MITQKKSLLASAAMDPKLVARFRRAGLRPDTAIFVDRRILSFGDSSAIECDGWLVPAVAPTERVGGVLVYVDTPDAKTYWHRYYCGEERNPNRIALGRGLVGWVVSAERVESIKRDVEGRQ
jgi:hypothetical protein